MMYPARIDGAFILSVFVACKRAAKSIFVSELQEEYDVNHAYLMTPRRIVWRSSTGESWVGSNPENCELSGHIFEHVPSYLELSDVHCKCVIHSP